MIRQKYFICLLVSFYVILSYDLAAQYRDVIRMKDGVQMIGLLDSISPDTVVFSIVDQQKIHLPIRLIKNHSQLLKYKKKKIRLPYAFEEQGIFHKVEFAYVLSQVGSEDLSYLSYTLGYSFSRHFRVGLGLSLGGSSERDYSALFVDMTSYLTKSRIAPFINVKIGKSSEGVGFGTSFIQNDRGYFVEPSLGIRLGSKSGANVELSIGLRWEDRRYSFESFRFNELVGRHERTLSRTIGTKLTF